MTLTLYEKINTIRKAVFEYFPNENDSLNFDLADASIAPSHRENVLYRILSPDIVPMQTGQPVIRERVAFIYSLRVSPQEYNLERFLKGRQTLLGILQGHSFTTLEGIDPVEFSGFREADTPQFLQVAITVQMG